MLSRSFVHQNSSLSQISGILLYRSYCLYMHWRVLDEWSWHYLINELSDIFRVSVWGTAIIPQRTLQLKDEVLWPLMKIITMKGLGRAGTACLPVPSIAEIIILLWKKITLTHTRTVTNPTGTEDHLGAIAMTPDIGFESARSKQTNKNSSVDNLP